MQKLKLKILAILIISSCLLQRPQNSIAQMVNFSPSETDPKILTIVSKISHKPGEHLAIVNANVPPRNLLVVFFPGTFGRPCQQQEFIKCLADHGYHVLALAYDNNVPAYMGTLNAKSSDRQRLYRQQVVFGDVQSGAVETDRDNAVLNRLTKALKHLALNYSKNGWEQYLQKNTNEPKWSQIILSGHSQGAGVALYLSKYRRVKRVVFLAGPNDFDAQQNVAAWIGDHSLTAASQYYALVNKVDSAYTGQQKIFHVLGLDSFGPPLDASDGRVNCRNTSHILVTSKPGTVVKHGLGPERFARVGTSLLSHSAVVLDVTMEHLPDGSPFYCEPWLYLFGGL